MKDCHQLSEIKYLRAQFWFWQTERRMIESWRPLRPSSITGSAAHLAGFIGKELTSGRLPCYPSSVWKLIPSSVSKPRDPLAEGWRESQQRESPLPPFCLTLWTCTPESLDVLDVHTKKPSAGRDRVEPNLIFTTNFFSVCPPSC